MSLPDGSRAEDVVINERLRLFLIRMRVWGPLRKGARVCRQMRSRLTRSRAIRRYLQSHPQRRLHLGCGPNILEGWLNTDLEPIGKRMVLLDVQKRFPFDDEQFDEVFTEHLIEHLDYAAGGHMLRECFRVLRPGGRITVATPDLQFLIDLHRLENTELQKRYLAWSAATFHEDAGMCSDVFVINSFFRDWGHQFIYDFDALRNQMIQAGFTNVIRLSLDGAANGRIRKLISHGTQIPEEFNRLETMVAQAAKPE